MTQEQAEELAMKTDYAIEAVGEEINIADAGAFFLEGYLHKQRELPKNNDGVVNCMGSFYTESNGNYPLY